jgi:hypothetical protein
MSHHDYSYSGPKNSKSRLYLGEHIYGLEINNCKHGAKYALQLNLSIIYLDMNLIDYQIFSPNHTFSFMWLELDTLLNNII